MKRVLVTGIAGSIGYHVANEILELTDWEVVGIDSFRHRGYHERVQYLYDNNPEAKGRLKIVKHDLCCAIGDKLKKEIGDVNYIIHLAAISDVFWGDENRRYTIKNNIESTVEMLEYASEVAHDAFVYFSTDEVYGPVEKGKAHKEWDTHRPSNTYSSTKAASEDLCYPYWRKGLVKLIITNTMNNFGQWQSDAKFPVLIQKAIEEGKKLQIHGSEKEIGSRYYIHSKRVARVLIDILHHRPPYLHKIGELDDPDRYHIVSKTCLNNEELVHRIEDLMGKKLDYELVDFHKDNPAHDMHYGLENNKLTIIEDFDEDMGETIAWQQKNVA